MKNEKGKIYPFEVDVTQEKEVIAVFDWAKETLGGVDIVVNNAGTTIKTNVKGKVDTF